MGKTTNIDMSSVVSLNKMKGDSKEDTALLKAMAREAADYIRSFKWSKDVKEQYFGFGVGGVVAVFLVQIIPNQEGVDGWLWVVVGDLPPAYLVADMSPNPSAALKTYIAEMQKWVEAVEKNESTDNVIPVNAPATREFAQELSTRLQALESDILPMFA